MNQELFVGALALGVPLFALGYLMLRRNRGVLRMYIAMLLIGLGYLTATGALSDIGNKLMGVGGEVNPTESTVPAPAPVVTPPAPDATPPADVETPPASEPAPETSAPASEPAPAPAP